MIHLRSLLPALSLAKREQIMSKQIRFGEPIEPEAPVEELPPEALLASGSTRMRHAPFQVYIVQSVYAEIWDHINQSPGIESGGVLIGHPFKTSEGKTTFVIITAAIPQHSDNRSVGHFTVGPDEIALARAEMEHKYPGLIAVGWYHSHPGHGIFLSGQDMTIVRSIYNSSWHIAMVIDPQRRIEGVFVGPEGKQIGGKGSDKIQQNWIGLREAPDSIQAIALYNQWQENKDILDDLERVVQRSSQLQHWRDGYRDTKNQGGQDTVPAQPLSPVQPIPPRKPPAEPGRSQPKSTRNWILASIFGTLFLMLFFCAVSFRLTLGTQGFNLVSSFVIMGFGFVLSLFAVATAWYAVAKHDADLSSPGTEPKSPDWVRYGALGAIILVVFSWCGLLQYSSYIVNLNAAALVPTSTPSLTSTPTSLPNTNTPIPPSATPSPSPSPIPTETPTLPPPPPPTETPVPPPPSPTETPTLPPPPPTETPSPPPPSPTTEVEANMDSTTVESSTLTTTNVISSDVMVTDDGSVLTGTQAVTITVPSTDTMESQPQQ